jgi:hypothetical protein
MSYWDIAEMAADVDIQDRVAACAAQEQPDEPRAWMYGHILNVTAQPGWPEAWAAAVAGGVENPGRDPGVITDGMVLSGVQTVLGQTDAPQ